MCCGSWGHKESDTTERLNSPTDLGLCWAHGLSPAVGHKGLLSSCSVRASHYGGFSYCGTQTLGAQASVVVAHGLSCPVACRISLGQGSNPRPLHSQADS